MIASMRKHTLANPVLLGGDVHQNWVGHVKADYGNPASPSIGVEFCGTSITARSDDGGKLGETLARNPHFVFADAERRGYGDRRRRRSRRLTTTTSLRCRGATVTSTAKFRIDTLGSRQSRLAGRRASCAIVPV
jgi:alkaline phosphatase D